MQSFRISGKLRKVLANYLTNELRKFRVGESVSTESMITSGVPQGSILGPLMFVVYVKDHPLEVDTRSAYGHADDFKVTSQSLQEAKNFASELEKWSKENMTLNLDKTTILCIRGNHAVQSDVNDKSKL